MKETLKKLLFYILQLESRLVLLRYKPKIIAITGSVGKTSTKDAVYAVLASATFVRKSEKSYNSEIGLPLTILGLENAWNNPAKWAQNICKGLWLSLVPHPYPKWLVLEVGVGKPGDMKRTASWLKTDVVIFTAIGETPAHIEFFNSREHLIEEKSGLGKTLKRDGLLVLNTDDEAVINLKSRFRNKVLTYGLGEGADLRGSAVKISYARGPVPDGIVYRIDEAGNSFPVVIEGVFGKNHVYASMAAIAVALGLNLNMINAVNALKNYDVPPGRMRLLSGIDGSLIIDDTYNSSPFAAKSGLETLGEVKAKRKIAILGDMLELGKHTVEAHKNIGKVAKENADMLIVVGARAQSIKEGAMEAGMAPENISEFANSVDAGEFAKTILKKGDTVLVKGSQGMRMERTTAAILLEPGKKKKLLVRQDREWLEKK